MSLSLGERLFGAKCVPPGPPPPGAPGGAVYFCNGLSRPARYRTYCTNASSVDDSGLEERLRKRGRAFASESDNGADYGLSAATPGFWVAKQNCPAGTRPEMLVGQQIPGPPGSVSYAELPYALLPAAQAIKPPSFFDRFRADPPVYSGVREFANQRPEDYRFVDLSKAPVASKLAGGAGSAAGVSRLAGRHIHSGTSRAGRAGALRLPALRFPASREGSATPRLRQWSASERGLALFHPRSAGHDDFVFYALAGGAKLIGHIFYGVFWLGGQLIRLTASGIEAVSDFAAAQNHPSALSAFGDYWAETRRSPKPLVVRNGSSTDLLVRIYYSQGDRAEPAMTASWLALPHFLSISKDWSQQDFLRYALKPNDGVVPPNFDGGILVPSGGSVVLLEPPYRFRWTRTIVGARPAPSFGSLGSLGSLGFAASVSGGRNPPGAPLPLPPRPFGIRTPALPPRPVVPQFSPLVPSPPGGLVTLGSDRYSQAEIPFAIGAPPPVKLAGSAPLPISRHRTCTVTLL